jgi:hypothetical protein
MARQEVKLLVVCGLLTQLQNTVQYATDLRVCGDLLATSVDKSRVRCLLKKTVKCWGVNWIKKTNLRGLSGWSTLFLSP